MSWCEKDIWKEAFEQFSWKTWVEIWFDIWTFKRWYSCSYKQTIIKYSSCANTSQVRHSLFWPFVLCFLGFSFVLFYCYMHVLHLHSYCHLVTHLNIFYLGQSIEHTVLYFLCSKSLNTKLLFKMHLWPVTTCNQDDIKMQYPWILSRLDNKPGSTNIIWPKLGGIFR